VSRIQVSLRYDDDENDIHEAEEVVLRSLADRAEWSFTIRNPGRDRYRYETTIVGTDGFRRRVPSQESVDEELLIRVECW
jgi:hypothetical protein